VEERWTRRRLKQRYSADTWSTGLVKATSVSLSMGRKARAAFAPT